MLASCGGSPSAPSATPATTLLPVTLPAGAYTLTIIPSISGLPSCSAGGICASVSLCSGTPDTTPARFDVQLERRGDEASVTIAGAAKPLTMVLRTASVPATGSIAGTAKDGRGIVIDVTGTLTGQGSANPAIAASGNIDGQVTVGGASCSNNGHGWTLSPR